MEKLFKSSMYVILFVMILGLFSNAMYQMRLNEAVAVFLDEGYYAWAADGLSDGEVAYGGGDNTLDSESAFTYDPDTNILTVDNVTASLSLNNNVPIYATDNGSGNREIIKLDTSNALQVGNSALTLPSYVRINQPLGIMTDVDYEIGMGVADTDKESRVVYAEVIDITDEIPYTGIVSFMLNEKTSGGAYTNGTAAFESCAGVSAGNTENWTGTWGAIGNMGEIIVQAGATGTLNRAVGFAAWSEFSGMTTKEYIGYHGIDPGVIGPAVLEDNYGIYLEDKVAGTIKNYAIYSEGGLNYFGGHVGVGVIPDANNGLTFFESIAAPTSTKYGISSQVLFTGNTSNNALFGATGTAIFSGNANTSGEVIGLYGNAYRTGSTNNMTAAEGLVGVYASAVDYSNAGVVSGVSALKAGNWGSNFAGGTVTNGAGLHINSPLHVGTLTNAYGIYIENITGAGSLNYSIYSEGGINAFAGNVLPVSDNATSLGDESHRWSLIRGVTITPGDLVFENGYRMTEAEKLGLEPGIALVSPEGEVIQLWQ